MSGKYPALINSHILRSRNKPACTKPFRHRQVRDAQVSLTIYDMLGRKVQTLVNERKPAGFHIATFDATGLSSGVYFYRLESGSTLIDAKKMLLLK